MRVDLGRRTVARLTRRTVWLLVAVAGAVAALGILSQPANHDVGWMLYAARRVLEGARLYVDVIEVNPPLVVLLSLPIVALAAALGAWEVTVFKLALLALIALSLTLASLALRDLLPRPRRGVIAYFCLVAIFALLPLFGYEFGQRDHVALVLVLPYLLHAAAHGLGHRAGTTRGLVVGVLGGIGVALKPYFLPIWLGAELYVRFAHGDRRAWSRPAHLALVATGAVYATTLVLVTPEYFRVAAWAAEVYDDFFPVGRSVILRSTGTFVAAGALLLAALVPADRPLRALRAVLAIAIGGFYLSLLLQNKGWSYHWLPVYASSALLLALTLLDLPRVRRRPRAAPTEPEPGAAGGSDAGMAPRAQPLDRRPAGAALALALTVMVSLEVPAQTARQWTMIGQQFHASQLLSMIEQHAPDGSISSLSTLLTISFPLVNYAGVGWASRFNCMWMLPGLYEDADWPARERRYHGPGERSAMERYLLESVGEDLARNRPDLLIVDRHPPRSGMPAFDYISYFSQDSTFRAEFRHYRLLQPVGQFSVFKREPEAALAEGTGTASGGALDGALDRGR